MLQRIEAWLAKPRAPLWLGLFAFALCLPALRFGLQSDDMLLQWKVSHANAWWSLFELAGDDERAEARDHGILVWWSSLHLYAKFFRPLASLSHTVEFTLWPNALWLMRLINAALYGATVSLAALLYRRLCPGGSAPLASLLFAIVHAHAVSAGWISGRNTLMALCFSLLALHLHVRAQDSHRARFAFGSVLAVALALGSAEAGLWSLCLLVSYALVLGSGSWIARLRSVAPQLGIGAIWAVVYLGLGCGLRGSSFYRDPSAPLSALSQGLLDLPIWFAQLVGPGSFPFSLLYPALWVRLGALPLALLFAWLLWPALRRSAQCRFFALAMLLCFGPGLCTLPQPRVAVGAGFGALGWIACCIVEARVHTALRERVAANLMLAIHLWLSALLFVPSLSSTEAFAKSTRALVEMVQPGRNVVVLHAPLELLSNYAHFNIDHDRPTETPRSMHFLYTGGSPLWVTRVDERTLEVEAERGWGAVPIERIFCQPEDMPRLGSRVKLAPFEAQVVAATADGRPRRVRFVFPTPLDAPERQWLTWEGNRVVPFTLPKQSQRVQLTPLPFLQTLAN